MRPPPSKRAVTRIEESLALRQKSWHEQITIIPSDHETGDPARPARPGSSERESRGVSGTQTLKHQHNSTAPNAAIFSKSHRREIRRVSARRQTMERSFFRSLVAQGAH